MRRWWLAPLAAALVVLFGQLPQPVQAGDIGDWCIPILHLTTGGCQDFTQLPGEGLTPADIPGAIFGAFMGILGGIVDALLAVVNAVMGLLPEAGDLGLDVPSGWIIGYTWIDRIVPLHEGLFWMGVLAAASVAPIVFHLAIAVYHLIPKPMMGT